MDSKRYRFQVVTSAWTNTSNQFAVVVGADFSSVTTATTLLKVVLASNQIDSVIVAQAGTSANFAQEVALPRRVLVPPGAVLTINSGTLAMVVICLDSDTESSLDNAVAIL